MNLKASTLMWKLVEEVPLYTRSVGSIRHLEKHDRDFKLSDKTHYNSGQDESLFLIGCCAGFQSLLTPAVLVVKETTPDFFLILSS